MYYPRWAGLNGRTKLKQPDPKPPARAPSLRAPPPHGQCAFLPCAVPESRSKPSFPHVTTTCASEQHTPLHSIRFALCLPPRPIARPLRLPLAATSPRRALATKFCLLP
jgi:hypothetical protein